MFGESIIWLARVLMGLEGKEKKVAFAVGHKGGVPNTRWIGALSNTDISEV